MTDQSGHYLLLGEHDDRVLQDLVDQGLVNQLPYGVDLVQDLSDEAAVTARADGLIAQRNYLRPADEYAEAIAAALRAGRLAVGHAASAGGSRAPER